MPRSSALALAVCTLLACGPSSTAPSYSPPGPHGCTTERAVPAGLEASGYPRCPTRMYRPPPGSTPASNPMALPRPPGLDDFSEASFDARLTASARAAGTSDACCYDYDAPVAPPS